MADAHTHRRLSAILAADVVGYSRMMGSDEAGTLAALKHHRETVFDPAVAAHSGRVVKLMGDGTLVEFPSVVDAVSCALDIQRAIRSEVPSNGGGIVLRIGVNLGDVIIDGDDIYGDGVNVAARLEPLAEPGGICIASIVNESVGSRVDAIFRDAGEVRVKNIDRPIRVWKWHPKDATPSTPNTASHSPETKPAVRVASIAVLPFDNMSGDPEQEYFSDGITEDIITDLSKVGGLMVIARNSSFAYKGKNPDIRNVGRELGVSSVLEGSIRRAGNRVRVTAQLIDTTTGGHLWAERYDRDLSDIFAVQDEVTLKIVDALKVTLTPREVAEMAGVGTTNLEAHEQYLRARSLITSPNINAQIFERTVRCGERAIELDPNYAQAYAGLALAYVFDFHNCWSGDPNKALSNAGSMAARAVELDPNDPKTHHMVAVVARWMGNHTLASEEIEKALSLNPNFGDAVFSRGVNAIFAGRPKDAVSDLERAMRLDPGFSQQFLHYLGMAHLLLGNHETAALMFRERLLLAPNTDIGRALLAATLGHLGEIDEARRTWRELMKINPDFSLDERLARMPFVDRSDASTIVEGLASAGLPD